jgi:glutamine amidotransferase
VCELFGLSSRLPTRATFCLRRFAGHGALGHTSVDGWGVAFYDLRDACDVRLYKEPEPAGDSAWLEFVEQRGVISSRLVSHIRRATRGGLTHSNTQPFARELAGRMHVFAHNGDVGEIAPSAGGAADRFRPVGQTDSEAAFCILMDEMSALWSAGRDPSIEARLEVVGRFAGEMRARGQANFLYSDGDALFAHGHKRIQTDGTTAAPGLWRLRRERPADDDDLPECGFNIATSEAEQDIILVASVPITEERWEPFGEGELMAMRHGEVVGRVG